MPIETRKKVYEVQFTWGAYNDKTVGVKGLTVIVDAADKFKAVALAWDIAKKVNEAEPERFSADAKYLDT